jgi:hypothetical protein
MGGPADDGHRLGEKCAQPHFPGPSLLGVLVERAGQGRGGGIEGDDLKSKTLFITRLAVLLSLTLAFQMIGLPQPVTGPVINALIFLSCALFGPWTALVLGCLTPLAALVSGQLPAPLWPLSPCVATANGILVFSFYIIRKGFALRSAPFTAAAAAISIILPSLFKFVFLAFCVKILLPIMLGRVLPPPLAYAFTAPQFFTALAGGALALGMIKITKRQLS